MTERERWARVVWAGFDCQSDDPKFEEAPMDVAAPYWRTADLILAALATQTQTENTR